MSVMDAAELHATASSSSLCCPRAWRRHPGRCSRGLTSRAMQPVGCLPMPPHGCLYSVLFLMAAGRDEKMTVCGRMMTSCGLLPDTQVVRQAEAALAHVACVWSLASASCAVRGKPLKSAQRPPSPARTSGCAACGGPFALVAISCYTRASGCGCVRRSHPGYTGEGSQGFRAVYPLVRQVLYC